MAVRALTVAALRSMGSRWLYLRTVMSMAGSTMIREVPCAICCSMPKTSPNSGMASKPPPMPSTPPTKPIVAPAIRHADICSPTSTIHLPACAAVLPSLLAQAIHRGIDAVQRHDFKTLDRLTRRIGPGNECHAEAQLGGLLETLLTPDRRPDLAGQTHFTKGHQATRQGTVTQRRHDRKQHRQVGR